MKLILSYISFFFIVIVNLGCGEDKSMTKIQGEMELYIDSVEDDFNSYQFKKIYIDTYYRSDYLYMSMIGEYSNKRWRDEYYKKYENRMLINKQFHTSTKLDKLYLNNYKKYDSLYNLDIVDWEFIINNQNTDTIYSLIYRLHYEINNKFNTTVKKSCIFSQFSKTNRVSKTIIDGYLEKDTVYGIGRKNYVDK